MRILFVCLGNICRSPTAEGVMRHLVRAEGLEERIEVDSAGTGNWHVGEPPDARATAAAQRREIVVEGSGRQFTAEDFERFDLILAMDAANKREILELAPDEQARAKVRLFREFDPESDGSHDLDVPDPYFGGERGFDEVLDLVDAAAQGLLGDLRAQGRV
jgi:protein-tyrosine phosphatase